MHDDDIIAARAVLLTLLAGLLAVAVLRAAFMLGALVGASAASLEREKAHASRRTPSHAEPDPD